MKLNQAILAITFSFPLLGYSMEEYRFSRINCINETISQLTQQGISNQVLVSESFPLRCLEIKTGDFILIDMYTPSPRTAYAKEGFILTVSSDVESRFYKQAGGGGLVPAEYFGDQPINKCMSSESSFRILSVGNSGLGTYGQIEDINSNIITFADTEKIRFKDSRAYDALKKCDQPIHKIFNEGPHQRLFNQ